MAAIENFNIRNEGERDCYCEVVVHSELVAVGHLSS